MSHPEPGSGVFGQGPCAQASLAIPAAVVRPAHALRNAQTPRSTSLFRATTRSPRACCLKRCRTKPAGIGLRETRRKEWLLDIEFGQRETFAYSCEAYARIISRAKSPAERRALAAEYDSKRRLSEERVDPAEVASIVAEAASARNGWKVILARCAPTTKPRSALQLAREMIAARNLADRT
jgi:hypothetical protein